VPSVSAGVKRSERFVAEAHAPLLDERREAQQRDIVEQVCAEQRAACEPRVRLGDRDRDDEAAVDDEVRDEVEHRTEVRRSAQARDLAIQAVERAVGQPQHKGEPPAARSGRDARRDPHAETDRGDLAGADAAPSHTSCGDLKRRGDPPPH
jgi:hypothetical protein